MILSFLNRQLRSFVVARASIWWETTDHQWLPSSSTARSIVYFATMLLAILIMVVVNIRLAAIWSRSLHLMTQLATPRSLQVNGHIGVVHKWCNRGLGVGGGLSKWLQYYMVKSNIWSGRLEYSFWEIKHGFWEIFRGLVNYIRGGGL